MDAHSLLSRLWSVSTNFGIARATSLTRLDRLGIPVCSVSRLDPFPESNSVSSGAGFDETTAELKALCEAIERWCGEPRGHVEIFEKSPPVRPIELSTLIPSREEVRVDAWCVARSLMTSALVAVPACAVFYPWPPPWPFAPETTGLAFGGTSESAALSGLRECIERDAYSQVLCRETIGAPGACSRLLPEELGGTAKMLAEKLSAATLELTVLDITGEVLVPTVLAVVWEALPDGGRWTHEGIAARSTISEAATAAILEAIQSRAVDIQGAREDLPPRSSQPSAPFYYGEGIPTKTPSELTVATITETLAAVAAAGLPEPLVFDLTAEPAPGVVVRVIAPKMEVCAFDSERIGERAARWATAQSYS